MANEEQIVTHTADIHILYRIKTRLEVPVLRINLTCSKGMVNGRQENYTSRRDYNLEDGWKVRPPT